MEKAAWLDLYPAGVPHGVDWPHIRLDELLYRTALEYPEAPALIFFDRSITYRELDFEVDRLAAGLQARGVAAGDRVSVMLPNCPQLVIAYEAVWRCGAVVVPTNPLYTSAEVLHQVADAGAKVAIVLSNLYERVATIRDQSPLEHLIVANIKDYFKGPLKALFTVLREKREGHRVDLPQDGRTHWWTDVVAEGARPQGVETDASATAVLMYTGGTTGVPKGARLTHDNLGANAHQVMVFVPGLRHGAEVVLSALPLTHAYAITVGLNLSVAGAFAQVLVPDPRDLGNLLSVIDKQRPTVFPGVPTLYSAIARHRHVKSGKYDVSSISYCISGAAPLAPDVHRAFTEVTGARLVEGYGLSEASPVTHCNPLEAGVVGMIGVPLPGTSAKIVDQETESRPVDAGAPGVLCVAGPQVMAGYWNQPEETADALRTDEAGITWLHTGDVAIMEQDGRFRIVDRKKDMILGAGGFNVYPREVEDVLYAHPEVVMAGVVGVPPDGTNQKVHAYVVRTDGSEVTEADLIEYCRSQLARYKVPNHIEFRDELPMTFVGKVLRRQLSTNRDDS